MKVDYKTLLGLTMGTRERNNSEIINSIIIVKYNIHSTNECCAVVSLG